jgi:hypothetical protein
MYPRFFLRLEPLGLDTIAVVVCVAGHDVWLLDLRVESHRIASHRIASHRIASQSSIADSQMST